MTVIVNDRKVKFQLDTGSDVNTLCQKHVKKEQVSETKQKLTMWNKTKKQPLGETNLMTLNPKKKTNQ